MLKKKSSSFKSWENKQKVYHISYDEWLEMKREELKEKKEQEEREKKLKEESERLKKEMAELGRFIWLKKKDDLKKAEILKKKREADKLEQAKLDKQKKSQEAVDCWLKEAKYKPKPVPSSMGLASLCTYNTTYLNPKPWIGSIEA